MAVRIKITLNVMSKNISVETIALLNAGYESDGCEVILPEKLAARLELFPQLPKDTIIKEYETVAGTTRMYFIKDILEVKAFSEKVSSKTVVASAVISQIEKEVILSDILIDELDIILEKCGQGLWRFSTTKEVYHSLPAQLW